MELIYSISEKRGSEDAHSSSLYGDGGICAVSCRSVVAFTRTTTRQDSYRHRIPIYTVCVMDLNCPYEPHVIVESASQVSSLVFSSDGSQLLVVRSMGTVQLFAKGAGLHDWSVVHTCDWGGEDILHINFFHGGIRTCFNSSDVRVQAQYPEKFSAQPHKPSLVDHGQCAMNGFFAVTASGLLLVCVLSHEGKVLAEQKVVLGQTRDNFIVATAALAPSGHIHIATWKPEMIKCWRVELRLAEEEGGVRVAVQAAQSFCPVRSGNSWHGMHKSEGHIQVTCLKYAELEDPNSLLVALTATQQGDQPHQTPTSSVGNSVSHLVQRYQLQDQMRPLLTLFKPMAESTGVTTKDWVCVGEWVSSSKVVTLGAAPRHLLPGSLSNHLPAIITAATQDSCVYAINRDTMHQMSYHNLQNQRGSGDDPPVTKRASSDRRLVSMAHTWSGFSMLAIDNAGSLHLFALLRPADVGPQCAILVVLLLEYALVSGHDWWDLLVATPPSSIHSLADRLADTFHQHSNPITQHLHTRFLVMKASVLRLAGSQQQRAIEARLQAQLTATQQLFRSVRPATCDVANAEKNVSASLQTFMESRQSLDILDIEKAVDVFCSSINIKDCQVDSGLLQNLQPLLQFAADLALFIFFMLAQNTKFELARDTKIVQSLREVLFVARLWHRQNKLVLPQMFTKTQSVDVWAQIYKLLTRVAQILPGEPDSSLIDECVLLETQVVCRELPLHVPARGVLADMASAASTPYLYEFGQQEGSSMGMGGSQPRILEGALPPLNMLDPLHYHYLAAQEPKFSCTRCCSVRGSWWGEGDTVWEQQWASNCICSGHWAHCPSTPSNAA